MIPEVILKCLAEGARNKADFTGCRLPRRPVLNGLTSEYEIAA